MQPSNATRRASRAWILLLLPLLAAAGWVLAEGVGEGEGGHEVVDRDEGERPTAGAGPLEPDDKPSLPDSDNVDGPRVILPPDSDPALRGTGFGVLRGTVTISSRLEFPESVEVRLEAQAPDEDGALPEPRSAWVGPASREFRFEKVPYGAWKLTTFAPGFRDKTSLTTLDGDRYDRHLLLGLESARYLRGRVTDADGYPAKGMKVSATEVLDDPHVAVLPYSGSTDLNGEFEIPGVLPGHYRIHAGPPRSPLGDAKELQLVGDEAWVEIVVPVTGRATVTILRFGTQEGLPGVRVLAQRVAKAGERGFSDSDTSGDDGIVRFGHLPAGEYSFTAFHRDLRRRVQRETVRPKGNAEFVLEVRPLGEGDEPPGR